MREITGFLYTAKCAAVTEGKEGYAVVISGAENGIPVVSLAGDGAKADGFILRGGVANEPIRIAKNGIIMCVAGAAINAIGEVQVNASGQIITDAAGVAIGKNLQTATTAGQIIPVFVY